MSLIIKPFDLPSCKKSFDVIRGLAVLLVFFGHLNNYYLLYIWPLSIQPLQGYIGRLGVDLFFILSGFLIWHSASKLITKKPDGLKVYFINRLTRIYPLYLFNITFIAVFATFFIGYIKPEVNALSFIRHLFFLQTIQPEVHHHLNEVSWTLTYEFAFYLLVPLLIYCRINVKYLILSIILMQIVWYLYSKYLFNFISFWPLFAVGIILSQTQKIINPFMAVLFLIISIYIFALYSEFRWAQFFFAFFLFNLILNFKYESVIFRPLRFSGLISYSLYLWHRPLILLIAPYITEVHFIMNPIFPWLPMGFSFESLIIILLILLVSTLSYFLIEKPSMTTMRHWVIKRI